MKTPNLTFEQSFKKTDQIIIETFNDTKFSLMFRFNAYMSIEKSVIADFMKRTEVILLPPTWTAV